MWEARLGLWAVLVWPFSASISTLGISWQWDWNTRSWLLLVISLWVVSKWAWPTLFRSGLDHPPSVPALMVRNHFFSPSGSKYLCCIPTMNNDMEIQSMSFSLGAPSCITQILSSWIVIMLGRFNKIIIMKVPCQLQSSIWKLLLRTAFLSADAPHASRTFYTFQGLFKFPGITSAPIWAQLIFLPAAQSA